MKDYRIYLTIPLASSSSATKPVMRFAISDLKLVTVIQGIDLLVLVLFSSALIAGFSERRIVPDVLGPMVSSLVCTSYSGVCSVVCTDTTNSPTDGATVPS